MTRKQRGPGTLWLNEYATKLVLDRLRSAEELDDDVAIALESVG
jgi:hypothetical protein